MASARRKTRFVTFHNSSRRAFSAVIRASIHSRTAFSRCGHRGDDQRVIPVLTLIIGPNKNCHWCTSVLLH
jgi:hypothetical protein